MKKNGKNNKKDKGNKTKTNNNKDIEVRCPFCGYVLEKKELNSHMEIHPSKVFDWLYIGGYNTATKKSDLQKINIKYILNCASECINLFENDFKYCKLDIKDLPNFNIEEYFSQGIEFLKNSKNNNDGNVFVHCQLGKSRSAAIIMAYMISEMKLNTNEAYKLLKKARSKIMPNLGFMNQLREYEKKILVE